MTASTATAHGTSAGGSTAPVVVALARRYALGLVRIPATLIPTILMPVLFVVAFGGSFSGLTAMPGFPTDNILNWMAPFAALQGCAFAGFGASLYVARDIETGFQDRLLASPTAARAVVLGPVAYAAARSFIPLGIVVPISLLGGATIEGGPLGVLTLTIAAVGVAVVASLWGLGVVYRLRSQSAGALVQIVITVTMFLSIGQMPLELMEGWLHTVARLNPVTPVLVLARQGFLGPVTAADTVPGLLVLVAMSGALGLFAWRGFRRLIP